MPGALPIEGWYKGNCTYRLGRAEGLKVCSIICDDGKLPGNLARLCKEGRGNSIVRLPGLHVSGAKADHAGAGDYGQGHGMGANKVSMFEVGMRQVSMAVYSYFGAIRRSSALTARTLGECGREDYGQSSTPRSLQGAIRDCAHELQSENHCSSSASRLHRDSSTPMKATKALRLRTAATRRWITDPDATGERVEGLPDHCRNGRSTDSGHSQQEGDGTPLKRSHPPARAAG